MPKFFRHPYTIGLHDTDAAGLIFSANLIRICHHGYEAFLAAIGYSMAELFKRRTMGLPIVHLEADFAKPLGIGEQIEIVLHVGKIGRTSYRIVYEILSAAGERCATAATVHVCVDPTSRQPMPLPEAFRAALLAYV